MLLSCDVLTIAYYYDIVMSANQFSPIVEKPFSSFQNTEKFIVFKFSVILSDFKELKMNDVCFDWVDYKERGDRLFLTFKYSDAVTQYTRALVKADLVLRFQKVHERSKVSSKHFDRLLAETLTKKSEAQYQQSLQFTGKRLPLLPSTSGQEIDLEDVYLAGEERFNLLVQARQDAETAVALQHSDHDVYFRYVSGFR